MTQDSKHKNDKRIVRNTIFLYIRQFITMIVGLFTSRIVLDTLGQTDFGIYGAVGGIVVVFSFLNSVMASACNRYFAIEIGQENHAALQKVFSLNITVFVAIAAIIIILSETIGLWFTNYKLVYPPDRSVAVNWIYQLSIFSFVISMLATPFRALIIANENMKIFAYGSIAEAILKLAMVCFLYFAPADKLVLYGVIMLIVNAAISFFYSSYCWQHYTASHYVRQWNGKLFREIVGYTGWNVIGSLAIIGKTQGVNLLLNIFFGPIINAAQAIATQVSTVVNQFSYNFMTAVSPQITKSYSVGENKDMLTLLCQSSKYSYMLMFIIIMPVLILLPQLLNLWLVDVPTWCVPFTRLTLINALVDSLSMPTAYAMQATGRVKWYQIFVGLTLLLIVPISYMLISLLHVRAFVVLIISIVMSIVAQMVRVLFVKHAHGLLVQTYIRQVVIPIIIVTTITTTIVFALLIILPSTITNKIVIAIASVLTICISVWFFGLTKQERINISTTISNKLKHNAIS